ncbi:MAG: adenylate cyclase [Dehalococcoidia bacterium]|nr:adenylate cyclase [Dehalococcoidia bacterium]
MSKASRLRIILGMASLGVFWGALASVPLLVQFEPLLALQLRVTDFITIQEGGLLQGVTRTPREDIIVLHDSRTGTEVGVVANAERDLALYRRLLEDGASAIGDLRFLSPGPESEKLMDGLVALEEKGLVLRQFDNRVPEKSKTFHSAASLYWFDSSRDLAQNIRFYPLLAKYPDGFREAMTLRLARAHLSLEIPTVSESLQGLQGYQLSPHLLLPTIHRPSKGASELVGEHVLWMNYVGPPDTFRSLPLDSVEQDGLEKGFFRGKIVIVDVGALGALGTPTSTKRPMTEAEMDANVTQSILEGRFLVPQGTTQGIVGIFLLAIVGGLLFGQVRPWVSLLLLLALLISYLGYATALYRSGTVPDAFFGPVALLGTYAVTTVYRYVGEERGRRQEEQEKRRIREIFGRYVAQPVVEKILQDPSAVALGGKRQEVTVLFGDIRGYTTLSEQTSPEAIVDMLNSYLTLATASILANEGTVDKYIGDAIMAYFNAPLPQDDHALRAIKAALEMQRSLGSFGAATGANCGIGVHTGVAIVGNVGSPQLMSYTVIGDAVNVASRLQSNAGPGEILISEGTYDQVRGLVEVDLLEPLQVKGRSVPIPVYRVLGIRKA